MGHVRKSSTTKRRRGYTATELAKALDTLEIRRGSVLMMHSSLYHLGRMRDASIHSTADSVVESLRAHLGTSGTLAVPAPNWDYGAKRLPFDIATTPVSKMLGVVSAHVSALPDRHRSANPIFSVAAIGGLAANICDGYSTNAFGQESPWQRMFDYDADMLCLGSDFEFLTFIRFMEARFGVPYLYNKYFDVPVYDDGVPIETPVIAPLRYAHLPIRYDPARFTDRCRNAGILRETAIGDGIAMAIRMQACFEVGMAALREDIHFFSSGTARLRCWSGTACITKMPPPMQYQHRYFEQTADRLPSAIAVDDHGERISYAELETRANRIAHLLISLGCQPNQRVVLFTGKDANQYAGLLGILKAGGCWIPFSNAFPDDRRCDLTKSLRPCAVVVDAPNFEAASTMRASSGQSFPIVVLNDNTPLGDVNEGDAVYGEKDIATMSPDRPTVETATLDDLAYIIFTSGSTGTPKGVMVRHRNVAHFLDQCPDLFPIDEGSRFAHFSDLTFDPSIFDLFHAWATGGVVVPFNRRKYRIDPGLFLRDQAIDVLFCVPTVIATLAETGQIGRSEFRSIRHLLLTGEAIPPKLVRQWYDAYPQATAYNMYGTTETAIISHCYAIPRNFDDEQPVPVGLPIAGMRVRLLTDNTLAPAGEPGESVVCGPQLSPGYWDSPYQTARAFVDDPGDSQVPVTVYRTGDLLRCDAEGVHHFVGRVDDQIKVRGHRIEPGEIEQAFANCDGVRDAALAVVSPSSKAGDLRLVVFVRLDDDGDAEAAHRIVAKRLPAWMVPTASLPVLQDFPRNANGKIDRAALHRLALDYFSKESRYGT